MIKSELVQRIATQNPHLYQRDVENIVNAILDEITAALARGDRVELRGFGAFSVKNRPARDRAAIRAPARMSRSTRRACRSSRPARKCASASTATSRARGSGRMSRWRHFAQRRLIGSSPCTLRDRLIAASRSQPPQSVDVVALIRFAYRRSRLLAVACRCSSWSFASLIAGVLIGGIARLAAPGPASPARRARRAEAAGWRARNRGLKRPARRRRARTAVPGAAELVRRHGPRSCMRVIGPAEDRRGARPIRP